MDIIKKTHEYLPNTYLVMHGSPSVPQELVTEINKYGGNVAKAMGVPIPLKQLIYKPTILSLVYYR